MFGRPSELESFPGTCRRGAAGGPPAGSAAGPGGRLFSARPGLRRKRHVPFPSRPARAGPARRACGPAGGPARSRRRLPGKARVRGEGRRSPMHMPGPDSSIARRACPRRRRALHARPCRRASCAAPLRGRAGARRSGSPWRSTSTARPAGSPAVRGRRRSCPGRRRPACRVATGPPRPMAGLAGHRLEDARHRRCAAPGRGGTRRRGEAMPPRGLGRHCGAGCGRQRGPGSGPGGRRTGCKAGGCPSKNRRFLRSGS